MQRYTTLTNFIDEQITKFNLEDTEENKLKLRRKFTRELEKLGIWEQAEIKLIGRNKTKVFTIQQLNALYNSVEPYLLKRSDIDIEELQSYRREVEEYLEELHNMTYEKYEKELEEAQYEPPQVTRNEAIEVMITALFEKFFEPLDVKQWNKDKKISFFTDHMDYEDIDYFQAQKRLNNPVDAYVKSKKQ